MRRLHRPQLQKLAQHAGRPPGHGRVLALGGCLHQRCPRRLLRVWVGREADLLEHVEGSRGRFQARAAKTGLIAGIADLPADTNSSMAVSRARNSSAPSCSTRALSCSGVHGGASARGTAARGTATWGTAAHGGAGVRGTTAGGCMALGRRSTEAGPRAPSPGRPAAASISADESYQQVPSAAQPQPPEQFELCNCYFAICT